MKEKRAIILINAYTASQTELNQPRRIQAELENLGVKTEIVRNDCFSSRFQEGMADFIVYLDKDKYCARTLENRIRLFNCAEAIELCDDKMLTHIALEGFPMPKTIAGALCYSPDIPVKKEILDEVERTLSYPVIVKECYGSLGKGVYKADNREELTRIAEKLKCKPHLYQQFIAESCGQDIRVCVVGGKSVACMRRVSQTDFRSNAELGGRGEEYELSQEGRTLCEEVAKRLRLDYCGIDLLLAKGGFLVCEVNSNAFFGTLERVSGVNVAKRYAEHIYREIYEN